MPHISKRSKQFNSSIFQDVFLKQQLLNNPIDLSVGLPEDLTPVHIKLAGIEAIESDLTTYMPTNGTPQLRQAIADKLRRDNDINVSDKSVTVVPGLTTGLLLVYMALLDPEDEVITVDPAYPPYHALASLIGAKAVQVPTLANFQLDISALEAHITHKTRAIAINSPNNPTGAIYTQKTLKSLATLAKKHNLYIISDEIYESFTYKKKHFSVGSTYANTITMNGFSKSHSMTGWRLGYIAGPQKVIDAINQLQQYIVFSSSSIAQHAALAALSKPIKFSRSYDQKRQFAHKRLSKMGYRIDGADGAYYMFFRTQNGLSDLELVEKAASHNLLLVPGRAFTHQTNYVRLSYGVSMDTLAKGLDILENITQELK